MIKTIERGWAGHFCLSHRCKWRRNTLVLDEERNIGIVVSSVGEMTNSIRETEYEEIGLNRYYETMIFIAKFDGTYWDADVSKQICPDVEWRISEKPKNGTDLLAEEMHEKNVNYIVDNFKRTYDDYNVER